MISARCFLVSLFAASFGALPVGAQPASNLGGDGSAAPAHLVAERTASITTAATRPEPGGSSGSSLLRSVILSSGQPGAPASPYQYNLNPSIVTCPVGNCPMPNAVMSAIDVYGKTTYGSKRPEWESVIGLFSATGHPNGQKVVQYLGGMQAPGAGSLWTLNTDVVRNATPGGQYSFGGAPGSGVPGKPGGIGQADGTIGYELDLTNWSEDDPPGGPFVVGLFINTLSSYSSLAGIIYGAAVGQPVPSWHDGILFTANTVRDNAIFDGSDASFSYQVGGTHLAAFYDNSTSQVGLSVSGSHASSDILLSDNAPIGISITGTHAGAAIAVSSGQRICFDDSRTSCLSYAAASGKWLISGPSGRPLASIDTNGNLIVRGRITEGAEP